MTKDQKIIKLRGMLDRLLEHNIANRGTEHQFARCFTYELKTGTLPPIYVKAEKVLRQTK